MTKQPDKKLKDADVVSKTGEKWLYSDITKDHFFNPRNFLLHDEPEEFDVVGMVGSPACGDVMRMWLTIDRKENRIKDCKWQTFGCGSAIASTSVFSEMLLENGGMKIEDALKITPQDIMERLGGLPARKAHCSVLAHKAFQEAIGKWYEKKGR